MSLKTYSVTLESSEGVTREVRVQSPTDVQAGDAASALAEDDEGIVSINEIENGGIVDAGPPKSQAAELAPVTPGAAAVPEAGLAETNG